MLPAPEDFNNFIERLFPEQVENTAETKQVSAVTLQVTDDCSLCCTYCYQINKNHHYMDFITAKTILDRLLDEAETTETLFGYKYSSGIVLEFIGGEPLLNTDLIYQVIEYFEKELILRDSPWLLKHKYNITSNGVDYFQPSVQRLLNDYGNLISLNITVDGNKELHDSCRLHPDGSGSYDEAMAAALDLKARFGESSTKITLCPENIGQTFDALINMLNNGFNYLHANCVFENVWTNYHDATTFYYQLKKLTDYLIDNDLQEKCYISLFDKELFTPESLEDNNKNYCGGDGHMLAIDYKGDYYPCIRFMESSLGTQCKPYIIGHIDCGICHNDIEKDLYDALRAITRESQSTDECINCPISTGCGWCTGYNYQTFGTPDKRATFICIMHKARALGNYYFWKRCAEVENKDFNLHLYLPIQECLKIIPLEEYRRLVGEDDGMY